MNRTILAGTFAATAILLASCDTVSPVPVPDQGPSVWVLGQKYGTTGSSSLDRISDGKIAAATPPAGMPSHSNTGICVSNQVLYLFDKNLGVVTGFDHGDFSKVTLDENVGASANPYEAASLNGAVWVARFGSSSLVALGSSGAHVDSIDLSAFDVGGATVPYMMAVKIWNNKLVVPVERLDANYGATDSSLVLVIDPTSHKIEKRILLPYRNPYDADLRGDKLALGCTGGWASTTDGGLAVVDLAGGTVVKAIPSSSLKGDPSSVAFTSDDRVWVGLDLGYPKTQALPVDLSSSKIGAVFASATSVGDLAFDGTSLWIANHDDNSPYVYEIDPATGFQKSCLLATLAPAELAVLP